MPMTDGFINVRIEVDSNGVATAMYYTEADLEANPEDPWSDGFGDIKTRLIEDGNSDVFDEKHRFIPFTDESIKGFLDHFGIRARREAPEIVELMMDDHTYIEYKGTGYYLPENNSFFTESDENILDYLNESYHT